MTSKNRSSWKNWQKASSALKTTAKYDELVADFSIASLHVTAVAFVLLILSGFSTLAEVYDSDGSEANIQSIHDNQARDGDTITIPAGTFSWTARLNITKGITLQGQTTISGAGTANPTINDITIIQDSISPRKSRIMRVDITPSQSFRMTGLTFAPGASTVKGGGDGAFHLHGKSSSSPVTGMRVDHCHFDSLYQGKIIWVSGWVYGVADHNVFDCRGASFPFHIWHNSWGGTSQINGNGSWADYPWYGTEKFFFMEDNTVRSNTRVTNSFVDTFYGGRWVARHNYLKDTMPSGHGTEGGAARGQRVSEFYNNTINITIPWGGGGQRSGTSLWHDNAFTGTEPKHNSHCTLPNFRETPARPHPVWGIADGTSVWDVNDTEGNGTYVEGHPPYLFDSGTDTSSVNSQGVIHDSTKNWTPNRWVGYSIKNTNPASPAYGLGSYIISNTSNTITYFYYTGNDGGHLIFNAGDTYQIHRVLTMMDQNGRGKGDQVRGHPQPINTTAGRPLWTHQALEPCYSWNNSHTSSGRSFGFNVNDRQPTTKEGIDFFNLGSGFPADSTPLAVSNRYTAALNGVQYIGTFVYPHPLVTAQPTPASTPSATSCSRLQRRLDRLQRRQQRLKRHHRSNPRLKRRIHQVQRQLELQHCL
jgi:hypothetical protein